MNELGFETRNYERSCSKEVYNISNSKQQLKSMSNSPQKQEKTNFNLLG